MKASYDIIVIGAGAGGLGVAIGMAKLGFEVLLIDRKEENFGGECLNSGCVPSKALIHVAGLIHKGHKAKDFGLYVEGKPDFEAVMRYVHQRQDIIRQHESAEYLEREEGIFIEIGEARFTGPNSVAVGEAEYRAKKIVVATGSRPRSLGVPGEDKPILLTNENLFNLHQLPSRFLIIGGGNIGLEMAQAFVRLGSEVIVVERGPRILAKELPEISTLVQERLEAEGVVFYLQSELQSFAGAKRAMFQDKHGSSFELEFDIALAAVGREWDYRSLDLPRAGVNMENGRPLIDGYLRARGNRHVLFAGDTARNMLFSHAAELHTSLLLTNFFTPWPLKKKLDLDHFSWCTFTDPEVCSFGFTEAWLKEKGVAYHRIDYSFDLDDRAVVSDYRYGRLILFLKRNRFNPRNGKILGGTVVAPQAGEMAQELILAQHRGLGAGAIFNKTYPYPVQSRVHKMALVEQFSQGISPAIKSLMKLLYH